MAYADYQFYTETFLMGDLQSAMPEPSFNRLSERAAEYIDSVTFGRAVNFTDDCNTLEKACCALSDTLLLYENGGEIISQSNDGFATNYSTANVKSQEEKMYRVAKHYLGAVGLMNRWV